MTLLGRKVAVSIPDTVLEEKDSLREKTAKLGVIARACAIYGVDLVEVFRDPGGRGEGGLIQMVLEYLETPQYLRRRLYPLDESLKFAGALPPLRIPSHKPKVPASDLAVGEPREGVYNGDGTVDIGLDVAPKIDTKARRGTRMTVKVTSLAPPRAVQIPRESVGTYWGYVVEQKQSGGVLKDGRFAVTLATSRFGTPFGESLGELRRVLTAPGGVKLVFGSPARGLFEIFGKELASNVTAVVNLFPSQQVETVRTEEAVFAGLGLLSLVSSEKA
jgi:methyltransferase